MVARAPRANENIPASSIRTGGLSALSAVRYDVAGQPLERSILGSAQDFTDMCPHVPTALSVAPSPEPVVANEPQARPHPARSDREAVDEHPEARALRRWAEQQADWHATHKSVAALASRDEASSILAPQRLDDHRARVDHGAACERRSARRRSPHWETTLRGGDVEPRYIPVGHATSGLYFQVFPVGAARLQSARRGGRPEWS